jgi:precorrin-3B synthase
MLVTHERQRGFCPSVWSPLQAGDGLLLRLRLVRARATAQQLHGLAKAAKTYGNGLIELTRRANLQLRGVTPSALPDLQAELVRLGFAEAAGHEGRAELLVCPLAGLERSCPGVEMLCAGLSSLLSDSRLMAAWSHKLVVLLANGSGVCDAIHADLHVDVDPARGELAQLRAGGTWRSAHALGAYRVEDVPRAVRTLLELGEPGQSPRMRDVVARRGAAALRALLQPVQQQRARSSVARNSACLGFRTHARRWFGFAVPFGALRSDDCVAIAEAAERFGSGEVAVTPARALLLLDVSPSEREALVRFAQQHEFALAAEAGLELVACSGAPACSAAQGETRPLASELGRVVRDQLRGRATLHVSGCEKSCAHDGTAEVTLVQRADGLRLGFGMDVAAASAGPPLSLADVRAQLASWLEGAR